MQKQSLNYLQFFALSAAVLAGWYWLAAPTDTPKKNDPNKQIVKKIFPDKDKVKPPKEVKQKGEGQAAAQERRRRKRRWSRRRAKRWAAADTI